GQPFSTQYAFEPEHPLLLLDLVDRLYRAWGRPELLDKLHVKSLFYQFVHELLRQLDARGIASAKPDPVSQAVSYMHRNYGQPLTLEGLADMLDCNPRQLLRAFKSRHQTSPIDY